MVHRHRRTDSIPDLLMKLRDVEESMPGVCAAEAHFAKMVRQQRVRMALALD